MAAIRCDIVVWTHYAYRTRKTHHDALRTAKSVLWTDQVIDGDASGGSLASPSQATNVGRLNRTLQAIQLCLAIGHWRYQQILQEHIAGLLGSRA